MACAVARGDPALVALLPQVEEIAEVRHHKPSVQLDDVTACLPVCLTHIWHRAPDLPGWQTLSSKAACISTMSADAGGTSINTRFHCRQDGGVPYQFVPPGFQMITLPFSDDIRLPEREPGFTGTEHSIADDAQVRALGCRRGLHVRLLYARSPVRCIFDHVSVNVIPCTADSSGRAADRCAAAPRGFRQRSDQQSHVAALLRGATAPCCCCIWQLESR